MDPKDPATPRELLEQLESLEPETLAEAGFDAEKVKRIRAEIEAGRFATDPERIADGLLGRARELLAQKRRKG